MKLGIAAAIITSLALISGPARSAPGPSTLGSFFYFAQHELRLKGFQLDSGDLGVSDGLLYAGGALIAPNSGFFADRVRLDTRSTCAALHANHVLRAAAGCAPATPLTVPIVADLATACGFPNPFPACDPSAPPVEVGRGASAVLGPGTYGALTVAHEGNLTLTGGEYTFCTFATSRRSIVTAQAPTVIDVRDRLVIGPQGTIEPASGLAPDALRVFVAGTDEAVQFSHHSNDTMQLCAPNGLVEVIVGSNLTGSFAADVIHSERGTGGVPSPSSSTTSTTSTTKPSTTTTTKATTTTTAKQSTTTTLGKTSTTSPMCPTTTNTTTTTAICTTTTAPVCTTTTTMMMQPGD